MSVAASGPAYDGDKSSLRDDENQDDRRDSGPVTPPLRPALKAENLAVNNKFLAAPFPRPIRPLSPDTLSNFSAEEFDTLRRGTGPYEPQDYRRSVEQIPESHSTTWRARLRKFYIRNLGLGYMLLGQIFGTLMNVTTRILEVEGNDGKGMHPFQILFARMGITCVLASGYMWWQKTPHFPLGAPEVRWWLVIRGLAGFCGVFGMYYSLLYLPLADATVLTFLSPGIANWACSKLINEPFSRGEQLGTLISLVGVIFIAKPISLLGGTGQHDTPSASGNGDIAPTNGTAAAAHGADASDFENVTTSQRLMAVGIAMIGVLGSAAVYTVLRAISSRAHPLISVNYFATWCFIVSIAAQSFLPGVGWVLPASLKEWGYLIFLGTCGFTMQYLLAAGLAYEKSTRATNIAYTQMLFALGFDKLIFGHTPDVYSIIGSCIITGSAIFVALKKEPDAATPQKASITGERETDEESAIALVSADELSANHEDVPLEGIERRAMR